MDTILKEQVNWEEKAKKNKKKLKKKKKELSILKEKYGSAQMMMQMTRNYMAEAKTKLEQQAVELEKTNKSLSNSIEYSSNIQQELYSAGKILEKTNKHLTDSIQYASRIQKALFSANLLYRYGFSDSFILLKPKDVVSGDAPWFYQSNNTYYAAAIDCTGHGVPGAMLTVLAVSLLNEIVGHQNFDSPRDLLIELDQLIHSYLRSSENKKYKSKDGLDISVICYNSETNELKFVGAHHKLYLWKDKSLQKVKGSRYNIGDANIEGTGALKESTFKVNKGDRAYLFSDGFPDQFGGEDNYKLMLGNFFKLIQKTATHSNIKDQQTELEGFFKNWKGENIQTDDVLVVGLEF